MTDSQRAEKRRALVAKLRDRHSLPLVRLLAAAAEAADEIEALEAECVGRMRAQDTTFNQAMSNGEAALQLRAALQALFDDYKQLADSGDAGFWRLEDQDVGKQALAALAA